MARDHRKQFQSVCNLGVPSAFVIVPDLLCNAIIQATILRSPRGCPLLLASSTCTTLLAQHFRFTASLPHDSSRNTSLSPLLFKLYDLHRVLTVFFLRMSEEAGVDSKVEEQFAQIRNIVEVQLKSSVVPGKSWWEVKG